MPTKTSSAVLSQTLHSITLTKIREIEKLSTSYEARKEVVLSNVNKPQFTGSQHDRIALLLKGVQDLQTILEGDEEVKTISRFVEQSKYDISFPPKLLDDYEQKLRLMLDIPSRELALAHLYSELLCEWMDSNASPDEEDTRMHLADGNNLDSDEFELVDKQKERLQQLCDRFEKVCFTPLETDTEAIKKYLQSLYDGAGREGKHDLERLRHSMQVSSDDLIENTESPFDKDTVQWCITSVLDESLLSDEKQKTLRDFKQNEVVLEEIADVLNMRWADFENWEWFAGPEGIPVIPRRDLSGKFRIWMDEDVLQAIFTQYMGVKWSVILKGYLREQVEYGQSWSDKKDDPAEQAFMDRWRFYTQIYKLPEDRVELRKTWVKDFFCNALPAEVDHVFGGYEVDRAAFIQAEPALGQTSRSIKQRLLHKMATDVFLQRKLHGHCAVVQTDLEWYATGLSHSTISAVMEFIGFPKKAYRLVHEISRSSLEYGWSMRGSNTNRTSQTPPRCSNVAWTREAHRRDGFVLCRLRNLQEDWNLCPSAPR